jgi:uncharacterized phage-like protein YoqJ
MLGGDRSNISRAADVFQKQGLIRTGRGWITIVDRQGLEDAACECYGIIKKEFDDFLGE